MKRVWLVGREAGHGARVPRRYRLAWYEPRRRVGVYFPAVLAGVARVARELGYRARLAREAPPRECAETFAMRRAHNQRQQLAEEYARGYMSGWRECLEACAEALAGRASEADARGVAGVSDAWDIGAWLAAASGPRKDN